MDVITQGFREGVEDDCCERYVRGSTATDAQTPEDLAELEETLDVLSDPDALADVREADAAYRDGNIVRGTDAVRRLRS